MRDSLGGNSKTTMLCNISPDDSNFGETLSSLRFAARAKEIPCHAEVNEEYSLADVQVMIRQLRSLKTENSELKHMIAKYKAQLSSGGFKNQPSGGYTPPRSTSKKSHSMLFKHLRECLSKLPFLFIEFTHMHVLNSHSLYIFISIYVFIYISSLLSPITHHSFYFFFLSL